MPRKGKKSKSKSKSKSRSAKEDAEADDAYLRREQERDAELLAASLYDSELSQHHQDEARARAAYLRRQLEQNEDPLDSRSRARTRRSRGEDRNVNISDAQAYGGLHISGAESDDVSSSSRSPRSDTSSPIGRMLNAVGFKSTVGSPPPSGGYIQVAVTGSDSESDAGGSRRIGRVGRGPRSAFSLTGKGWREDVDESELEAIEATAAGAGAGASGEESAPLTSESESEAGRRSYGGHGGGLPPGQRRMQGQRYVRGLYAAPKGVKSCLSAPFSPDARAPARPRTHGNGERRRKRKGSRGKVSFATSSDSDAAALSSGPPSEAEPDEREKEKLRLRWSPSLDRIERQYTDGRQRQGHGSGSGSGSGSNDGSDSDSDSERNRDAPVAVAPAPRSPNAKYGGGSNSPEVELQPMSSPESPEDDDNDGTLGDASSCGEMSDMSEGTEGESRPLPRSKGEVERSQHKRKHKKSKSKSKGKSREKRGHKDFVVRRLKPEEKELLYRTRPDLQISTDWARRYYDNPSIAEDDDEEGDMSWIESGESGNRLCGPNAFGVSLQCSGFLAMALLFVLVTILLCLLKWLVGDDGDQYANMMGPLEQRGRGGAGNFVNSHGSGDGAHLRGALNGHERSRDDYFR